MKNKVVLGISLLALSFAMGCSGMSKKAGGHNKSHCEKCEKCENCASKEKHDCKECGETCECKKCNCG